MKKIKLAFGKAGLEIELPSAATVIVVEPTFVPGLADPPAALQQALRAPIHSLPLRQIVKSTDRIGIVFSDITRPTPHRQILPAILNELSDLPRTNILLFNALGTHRPNTEVELRDMLGDSLVNDYCIVQNNSFDPSTQVCLGTTMRGHETWVNRELVECDVKILTGFIEPHLFAGFSGGGKAIMPGMAGQKTILGNHDARMIANLKSTWGETRGNPIWEEVREVAQKMSHTFLVNVTLNKHKEITRVFAGNLVAAHDAGCTFVKNQAMVPVAEPFDIVITTNSGYPLDLNLYQSVKGMSTAAQVVRQGGAIIIATECWDGIPEHGLYGELLRQADSPHTLLELINTPGFLKQDQWQAQIQLKCDIYVHSDHLTDEQIRAALLKPCHRIEDTVAELLQKYGASARICVMPEGPQTIPYLREKAETLA